MRLKWARAGPSCGICRRRATWYGAGIARRNSPDAPADPLLAERIRRATAADAVLLGERIQSLWGGYGELWRAELSAAGGARKVVVKVVRPPRDDGSRSHRRKLRSYAVEQAFYAQFAARCGGAAPCRVAEPIAVLADQPGWLFVLEDLNAAGYAPCSQGHPSSIEAILGWLARFHARFLHVEPERLWKTGTYWHLATRQEELSAMRHQPLRRAAARIDATLSAARFKTLVHGDAKLENVCFGEGGDVALVDFQYVGGGVGVKDVAYLLDGCVAPRDCKVLVPAYLDAYFRELRQALTETSATRQVDADEVEREWRELFPLAWLDFYRFLLGWAPGQFDRHAYSEELTSAFLSRLT